MWMAARFRNSHGKCVITSEVLQGSLGREGKSKTEFLPRFFIPLSAPFSTAKAVRNIVQAVAWKKDFFSSMSLTIVTTSAPPASRAFAAVSISDRKC
jgi:hypothetical protein